ncbi:MAG: hypothetical protein ABID04_01245 [Patescibacteria group bacterium]
MFFNFTGSFSKTSRDLFKIAQEKDLEKIADYLEAPLEVVKDIKFEVFSSRERKQDSDPFRSISRASARFAEMTIYRYWEPNDDPHFPHEITHLVAHTWEKPYIFPATLDTADEKEIKRNVEMLSTSFLQEGLAIAVDEIIFNRKLLEGGERKFSDEWCKENNNKIPALRECINFDGFNSFENKVVVPFTASLVKFLLTNYGLRMFKKAYVETKEIYSSLTNVKIVESIYAKNEDELLRDWRNSLNLR